MNEKYILKRAMGNDLPGDIVNRHKQPYRAPDVKADKGKTVPDSLRQYLSEGEVRDAGLFDPKKVAMLTRKAESPRGLNVSESQAFTGILTTQILNSQFCK